MYRGTDGSCTGGSPPSRGGHQEMAQIDGWEQTSWQLGKASKSQSRYKKNSSDFHPLPHNCQEADELGTSCQDSLFPRGMNGMLPCAI